MAGEFIAGAVAGALAGRVAEDAIDTALGDASGDPGTDKHLFHLHQQTTLLDRIVRAVEKAQAERTPPTRSVLVSFSQTVPYQADIDSHDHLSMFVTVGFPLLIRSALGDATYQLASGWNAIDPPSGARFYVAADGPATMVQALLRWSDDSLDIAYVSSGGADLTQPAEHVEVVAPSDTVDLPNPTRGLYVGGAGNIVVTTVGGEFVTFSGVGAGTTLPVRVRRVWFTNTTATNLLGLY